MLNMTDTPHTSSHAARRGRSLASVLVVAGTFGLAACSDSTVAPATETAPALAALPRPSSLSASVSLGKGVTLKSTSTNNGVTRTVIIVDPRVDVSLGGATDMVSIPANSICRPGVSGYGPEYWDRPCSPATAPITFEVESWTDKKTGQPRVEFTPDVRFSPAKMVGLYLKSTTAQTAQMPSILWCTNKSKCVDEALTDKSLATQRDRTSGYVYRRVKHFSGYMVSVGLTGEGEPIETTPTYP
jgi:hypothetical protein